MAGQNKPRSIWADIRSEDMIEFQPIISKIIQKIDDRGKDHYLNQVVVYIVGTLLDGVQRKYPIPVLKLNERLVEREVEDMESTATPKDVKFGELRSNMTKAKAQLASLQEKILGDIDALFVQREKIAELDKSIRKVDLKKKLLTDRVAKQQAEKEEYGISIQAGYAQVRRDINRQIRRRRAEDFERAGADIDVVVAAEYDDSEIGEHLPGEGVARVERVEEGEEGALVEHESYEEEPTG